MKFLLVSLLTVMTLSSASSQDKIPYGNNIQAGKYLKVDGVRLYYETYGTGEPLLMLHGGVYGYIDEYEHLIPELAKHFQVICLATRGHGKSEIGHESLPVGHYSGYNK